MNIRKFPTEAKTAFAAANEVAEFIRNNRDALVCLAAGDTMLPVFQGLLKLQRGNMVDLSDVYYVGLDEWVGLDRKTKGSCEQVMFDEYYTPAGIPNDRICVWNGTCENVQAERARIESWISSHDGIDLTVLGIGMNGHIGFNEPHSGLQEGTVLVTLDAVTRAVSSKYFDKECAVEYGVTIGALELKKAQKLILIATGIRKAEIVKKTLNDGIDTAVPASLMMDHLDVTFFADEAALTHMSK